MEKVGLCKTPRKYKFISPFNNDPFAITAQAFVNLFPGKRFEAEVSGEAITDRDGEGVYGLTSCFGNEFYVITIDCSVPIKCALETFGHELAHVAVGAEHEHDEVWEKAFLDIYNEYVRIENEMFPDPPQFVRNEEAKEEYTR